MTEIHHEIFGQGQPLVMIHGWSMHTGIWRGFARQLAKQWQVICLDLPGHGRSENVEPFDLPTISAALFDAIPVNRFTLLGWSLGATIALDMAASRPERVKSLYLLAGNPKFVKVPGWPGVRPEVLEGFSGQLCEDARLTLHRFLGLQVQGLVDGKRLLQELRLAVEECEAPAIEALQGGLRILKKADLRPALAGLCCPVTVIQGDKDTLIPIQTGNALQSLRPGAGLHVLENAGHVPFLSHSARLCEIIAGDR